jgi:hypothetical protein
MAEAGIAARQARMQARLAEGVKRCPRCQRELDLDAFWPSPSRAGDQLSAYCKTCSSADSRERWQRQAAPEPEPEPDPPPEPEPEPPAPRRRGAGRQPAQPPIPDLPRAPDWSAGLCSTLPASQRAWWTSESPAERNAAADACLACPILEACSAWALAAGAFYTEGVVYAGMLPWELRDARKARRAALAALAEELTADLRPGHKRAG